ncbi:Dihydrolipoyllysine-residue acetyltransferase component of pyruvate dehydrogenase complex [Microbulbifer aggregans]|uniref:Dihydrolipoamide acetyltransferase component of pyruvate dehydrogenase complex n=1 Tax=Microbulbifer aggregans TaxID=1769779 RepID=A0A1C9W9X6_9GAMM|nr:dihydrolipoamide acetyltransferase family protein [Microbulbifer aggregans]AOS97951.1 Dihydrolipoyllysine-residue acetyltransferase component of pyruvate dehydrogenase complex [Microbulbifer aggregans]
MPEFRLPSLGADMESATLREWFVQPGAVVKKGDVVASVETDKGIIDIEIHESGTIAKLLVQPDEKVPVGAVLATLDSEQDLKPTERTIKSAAKPAPLAIAQGPDKDAGLTSEPEPEPELERLRISPLARRRARELAVDPASVTGSGPDGAITLEDIERYAGPAAPPEPKEAGMRRAIAAAMSRSKREIPHYYLSTSIDVTGMLAWLQERNAKKGVEERMLYVIPLLKAVAGALKKVPELNGHYRNAAPEISAELHLGVAISLRSGGLVVPVLRGVQDKPLDSLMPDFADLVNRARTGHLRSSEVEGATITISSLGDQGVEVVFPVIHPPQLAIVGFGSVAERVRPVDGKPAVRQIICASLAADHRASDGHRGAIFLAEIDRLLQEPEKL